MHQSLLVLTRRVKFFDSLSFDQPWLDLTSKARARSASLQNRCHYWSPLQPAIRLVYNLKNRHHLPQPGLQLAKQKHISERAAWKTEVITAHICSFEKQMANYFVSYGHICTLFWQAQPKVKLPTTFNCYCCVRYIQTVLWSHNWIIMPIGLREINR